MNDDVSTINLNMICQRAYRWAIVCGIKPVLLGMLILLVWWKTRWLWLVNAESVSIITGLLFISFGLIYFVRFWILTQWMLSLRSPWGIRQILTRVVIFGANFVGAAAVMLAVLVIQTAFSVEIQNFSRDTIRNAEIVVGGCRFIFDRAIPAGGTSRRTHWIKHDDQNLILCALVDYRSVHETFKCDVTSNQGGFHAIIIKGPNMIDFDPVDGGD